MAGMSSRALRRCRLLPKQERKLEAQIRRDTKRATGWLDVKLASVASLIVAKGDAWAVTRPFGMGRSLRASLPRLGRAFQPSTRLTAEYADRQPTRVVNI